MADAEARSQARLKGYHQAFDEDARRRGRLESSMQLRRERVAKQMSKRRTQPDSALSPGGAAGADAKTKGDDAAASAAGLRAPKAGMAPAERALVIDESMAAIRSGAGQQVLAGVMNLRRVLSNEARPPVDDVLRAGALPALVSFLPRDDDPKLQFEATWCVTNIASGTAEHTAAVVGAGATDTLIRLLGSHDNAVREQAVWAIGNIAGDTPAHRDLVIGKGGMLPILNLIRPEVGPSQAMLRNVTWCISNFCRGKPRPALSTLEPCAQVLSYLLTYQTDVEVLTDACWALSYLSDGAVERVQAVIDLGIVARIVELLDHEAARVRTPALRTMGNIITGDDTQTDHAIAAGVLPKLYAFIQPSTRPTLRKEAMWAVSNICAGTHDQLSRIIAMDFLPAIVEAAISAPRDIRKEAAWAISNGVSGGTPDHVFAFVRAGVMGAITSLLRSADNRIITVGLTAIDVILRVDADSATGTAGEYKDLAETAGVLAELELLQDSADTAVFTKAQQVLSTRFADRLDLGDDGDDEDDEDDAINGYSGFANFTGAGGTLGGGAPPFGGTGDAAGAPGSGASGVNPFAGAGAGGFS